MGRVIKAEIAGAPYLPSLALPAIGRRRQAGAGRLRVTNKARGLVPGGDPRESDDAGNMFGGNVPHGGPVQGKPGI